MQFVKCEILSGFGFKVQSILFKVPGIDGTSTALTVIQGHWWSFARPAGDCQELYLQLAGLASFCRFATVINSLHSCHSESLARFTRVIGVLSSGFRALCFIHHPADI